jgi:hypothetical protein
MRLEDLLVADDFILVPENTCFICGATLNAVSQDETPHTEQPHPGDLTLCGYCFTPMLFTDTMGVRPLTLEETEESKADIAQMRQSLSLLHVAMEAQGWRNPYGRPRY